MPGHDIIVVGASAGGVEALTQLVNNLPPDLPAAIFVVLHISSQGTSVLHQILNRSVQKRQNVSLQATRPLDYEKIQHGRIYVAPPNQHLLVKNGYIRLGRGPKENSHRPAVDPLFRTAARVYGSRVVGVVLSGTLDDGTAGLSAVKNRGGVAIVQNPEEALYAGMPRNAIENVDVDHILSVSEIASVLVELAAQQVQETGNAVPSEMEVEADMAELDLAAMQQTERPGTPSPFGCPECGGVLWELEEGKLVRFRCRTGHAFSASTLMAEQSQGLEEALWVALRTLEERAALAIRMASQARQRDQRFSAKRFEEQGQDAQQRATLIRDLLLKGNDHNYLSELNGYGIGNQVSRGIEKSASPPSHLVVFCASDDRGIEALSHILSALPADFSAAIVVACTPTPQFPHPADTLSSCTELTVKQASGDLLSPGTVYIAPPNQHLMVNPDRTLHLFSSELVHSHLVDLLFESVAATFSQRAIAVVLTGSGNDGAMGLQIIKKMGGTTITQAQTTSLDFSTPGAAIDLGTVDLVVPLNKIGAALVGLVGLQDEET